MSKANDSPRFYRPELDAVRFVAFIFVFLFHYTDYVSIGIFSHPVVHAVLTAGTFSLPVFFLLSSFLIVELLLRELEKTGQLNIRAFYARRILRIWPLYFAVLFSLIIARQFIPIVRTNSLLAWLAFTFFSGNWYVYFFGWIGGPVDPLWSIAIEEQFYGGIPLLTKFGGRKLLIWLSVFLILVCYGWIIYYAHLHYKGDGGQWVNSFFQFQFFAAGTLLAIYLNGRIPKFSMLVRLVLFVAAALCFFIPVYYLKIQSYTEYPTVLGAVVGWAMVLAGTALVFLAVYGMPGQYVPKLFIYIGRISFGMYLFHNIVFHLTFYQLKPYWERAIAVFQPSHLAADIVGGLIAFGGTVGLAILSYRYFEKPFLKIKKRFTIVRSGVE